MADATDMSPEGDSQFHFDVIHWNDEPVVTTAQLADFYGVTSQMIRNNYNRNAGRFEDGKHMYILSGCNIREFRERNSERVSVEIAPRTKSLTLWTRRGAARHAKMLSSDRAWEVFEALEDSYFSLRPDADFPLYSEMDRPGALGVETIPQAMAVIAAALEVWEKQQVRDIWNRIGLPEVDVSTAPMSTPDSAPVESEPVKQSEPRAGTDEARILGVIRDAGEDGVVRSIITRRFRTIRAVDIDDILDSFVRAGLIRRVAAASAACRSGIVLIAI